MRKVVLYQLLSLDGVAEEPSDWIFELDQEFFANLGRIIAAQDTVLLGRKTYDYWAGHWPTSDLQPFADFINNTEKHVFTSSTPAARWTNTTVVNRPATEHVPELKRQAGRDIGIHGSIELARGLLSAGLVDELRLVVIPTIAGTGRRLFDPGQLRRLELLDARRTPAGTVLLGYRIDGTA